MIDRWEAWHHRWRHRLSRNAWLVRLLGMSVHPASASGDSLPEGGAADNSDAAARGLLLIQIDGLARRHFEAAVARGRMPFAERIMECEDYHLYTMYAGIPSTTPAVQGELFYGVRQAVPAFAYRDGKTGQRVRMYRAEAASRKQTALDAETSQPLLAGGSAYCNIYTGGAAEPHYCASALGWGQLTDGVRPWTWLLIGLLYTPEILRACWLAVLEGMVALRDAIVGFGQTASRPDGIFGSISRHHLRQEMEFVLRRVTICVVLRELATIAASLDAARGLPIVEVNFLGYDEQSHHRGPDAEYAHWSLGGIDNAIQRIWQAAARSPHREFDLWIYSDHGQERVTSYTDRYGRSVQQAVYEVFSSRTYASWPSSDPSDPGHSPRASYLRRRALGDFRRGSAGGEADATPLDPSEVEVIAMGPLGFVYYQPPLSHSQWAELAAALVQEARVPLVLLAEADGRVHAWAAGRHGYLPEDAADFLGPDHPFLEQAAEDLIRLAAHRDAGQLVIGGWATDEEPLTFVLERGAHAGCGADELSGFALLPPDTPLADRARTIRRPQVLREAVLRHRSQRAFIRSRADPSGPPAAGTLRAMTYNIHSCIGMDGRAAPDRVARVIAAAGADVVALQEVDAGRQRSGFVHQARRLSEMLDMHMHFHSTVTAGQEEYGHAVLSRWPLRVVRSEGLPTRLPKAVEPRSAIWVELDVEGQAVQLLSTHLGLLSSERSQQIRLLLGPEWLGHPACCGPVIFCGDLNAGPRSSVYRQLAASFTDVQAAVPGARPQKTFFSRWPIRRIDHMFVRGAWHVTDARVIRTALARRASDHLPLVAELRFAAATARK